MTIIIVGATGFIGTEITKKNRSAGHHVLACGRSAWEGKIASLFPDKEDYFCTAEGDLPSEWLEEADGLVLLAAKRPYAGFCYKDYADNVELAHQYLSLAMEHNLKNIVFASSKAVYSGADMPWKEDSACTPSSLYGASKLAVEQLGLYYSEIGQMRFKSLRFAQVIGAGERQGYLINTLIDNARAKRAQIIFGSGEQKRQYVYVKDVASAIMTAEERSDLCGVFNIGMKGSISNLKLAQTVNDCFDNMGNLVHDYSRNMFGTDDEMCVDKAEKVLGFRAKYGIRETFVDLAREAN